MKLYKINESQMIDLHKVDLVNKWNLNFIAFFIGEDKYEKRFDNAPLGKTFEECYDLETLVPSKEYQEIYGGVKEEFKDLGIDYIY